MLLVYTIPEFRNDMLRLVRNFPSSSEIDKVLTMDDESVYAFNIKNLFKGFLCTWMNEIDRQLMLKLNTEVSSALGDIDNIMYTILAYRADFYREIFMNSDFVEVRSNIDTKDTTLTTRDTILSFIKTPSELEGDITVDTAYYDTFKEKFCVVTIPTAMLNLVIDNNKDIRRKIMQKILETNTLEVEDLFTSKVFRDFINEDVALL